MTILHVFAGVGLLAAGCAASALAATLGMLGMAHLERLALVDVAPTDRSTTRPPTRRR